jgi:dTDP-4-amino-4,6-dideoxygalactose transaminase
MQVPIARPFIGREEEMAVQAVLRSGWLSQGPRVAEFEKQFAAHVGAPHAVAVSSCTTALHLALIVAGVGAGDEVLCPSLSFIASANAIRYVGAEPVFVDIDPETFNLDPRRLESAVTPRTRAILLVHQVGLPAAISEILDVACQHNLVAIEDAACATGSAYRGQRIGLPHSSMACFSFHPRKILTTGEGGMITTASEDVSARLRRLRQHAMSTSDLARHQSQQVVKEGYDEVGFNFRMTDLQAAVGVVQLNRLESFLAQRRKLAALYAKGLSRLGWLLPPVEASGFRHNFQSYMVRLAADAPVTRDALMQLLLDRGVATRRGVMPIHREAPYRDARWEKELVHTNHAADNSIILPLFNRMTEEELYYVLECLAAI